MRDSDLDLEDLFGPVQPYLPPPPLDMAALAAPMAAWPADLLDAVKAHLRSRRALLAKIRMPDDYPEVFGPTRDEDPVGSWSRRGGGGLRPLPPVLADYIALLTRAVAGEHGEGIPAFVATFIGQPQIVRLCMLDEFDEDGSIPNDYRVGSLGCWSEAGVAGSGDHRRIRCMFHGEESASMHYSVSSRYWHCYGCGAHETSVSLVARLYRLRDREAVDLIRRWYGLSAPPWPLPSPRRNPVLPLLSWRRASPGHPIG